MILKHHFTYSLSHRPLLLPFSLLRRTVRPLIFRLRVTVEIFTLRFAA